MTEQQTRTTPCKSCGAPLLFLKTAKGKNMPVDANSVELGDAEFERSRHVSHWDTCPEAAKHSRRLRRLRRG